ncbi:YbaB/EbfC family nucleoid-associated protein [Streptomyces sp. NPDC000594]|uniref:YbaB/EbfC family nucleoid-associated protein n=1 Tax=Streptomyces sp. NPDC000594 TaxID=3154261 RepID=UPI0033196732
MKPSSEALLKEIMDDLGKARDTFLDVQRQLGTLSTTAESPDRLLTVAVDSRGELTSLTFRGTGYRSLPPARLAETIVATVDAARRELMTRARLTAEPVLGDDSAPTVDGVSLWDLLPGRDDPANAEFFRALRGGLDAPEEPRAASGRPARGGTGRSALADPEDEG